MLSLLYLRVQAQQYFVSLSYMVVDKKIVLKIWLNLGLNLTVFRGTGPRAPSVTLLPVSQRFMHPAFRHPHYQIPSVLLIPSKKFWISRENRKRFIGGFR